MGFAINRREARQLVRHCHFLVNGKRVSIPSFLLRPGDIVEVREKSRAIPAITDSIAVSEQRGFPQWLEVNTQDMKGKFVRIPTRDEINLPVQEQLIVELYSK
jgi:small subunit ribosomal protein S4